MFDVSFQQIFFEKLRMIRRLIVRSFAKKNQKVLMKIEEMADAFLNSANFAPHALLTLSAI
jgi:hypothetical protein